MAKHSLYITEGRGLGGGPPSDDPSFTIQVGVASSNVGIVSTTCHVPGVGKVPVFEVYACTNFKDNTWKIFLGRIIESVFVPSGESPGHIGDSRQDKI